MSVMHVKVLTGRFCFVCDSTEDIKVYSLFQQIPFLFKVNLQVGLHYLWGFHSRYPCD